MPEIPDPEFLELHEGTSLVGPEDLEAARRRQDEERHSLGSCRSLYAILREQGAIDPELEAELLRRRGTPPRLPQASTVIPPPDTTRPITREISSTRSARRPPPEVEAAARDPRNRMGPFILFAEAGRGGMGKVWKAWDENVGRVIALKVIDADDATARERFVREAQIAGKLHHPAIATVFQAGEQGTKGYIAMQFIDGGPIDAEKRPLLATLELVRDAALALSYAHDQGVVHRDVKPGNLMVDRAGNLYLTDFGLAKEAMSGPDAQLSITGTTFGTPQYMSPEQARGEHRQMDVRSDVYSLGATLYALLAGRPPYTAGNLATLLMDVIEKKPPPLSRFNREISPELQMVVERAMCKDVDGRFPTMTAFADELERLLRENRYSGRHGLTRQLSRKWLPVVAAAVMLALAFRWLTPQIIVPVPPTPARDEAGDLLSAAAVALEGLERQGGKASAERIERDVIGRVERVLLMSPNNLRALVLRLRARYLKGEGAKELEALKGRRDEDYRIALVAALLALEQALAEPPPLPAPEAPAFEWESRVEAGFPRVARELEAAAAGSRETGLENEFLRDAPAIAALRELAAGRWDEAADALNDLRVRTPLPIYDRAWCRSSYLARRFAEVAEKTGAAGRRERAGALLAIGRPEPAESEDPWAEAAVRAALARRDGGADPERHAREALRLLDKAAPERRASVWAALLRRRSLDGRDAEKDYREAIALASPTPASWEGRLAAVELRIGLATRLLRERRETEARTLLDEAARRADEGLQAAPGWEAMRVVRGQLRVRKGDYSDARTDVDGLPGARARLVAATARLGEADRHRRAEQPYAEEARAARREALGALTAAPDHPEGEALAASASILLALDDASAGRDEGPALRQAVESLDRVLDRLPEYVDARFQRARALHLQAEAARRSSGDGKVEDEAARADLNRALHAAPTFGAARNLRAIVNYSLGHHAEAASEWRALLAADPAWNTPEVRGWLELAESKSKPR